MSTGVRELAEGIFIAIAELPRERWEAEIASRCNADHALEREVRSLLDCHAEAEGFLDASELEHARPQPPAGWDEDTLPSGTTLGEYVLLRLLGRGGMGSVYIAQQDRPRRTVAIKIIRRGLGTQGLLRRFEHEAEILGKLQHPGIAQIYEAGSAPLGLDGADPTLHQPYIAMELIEGPPINAFANDRALSTPQRMELVALVCDAVHHAHQRGIIHRDLKPANILVDPQGQPKILDFGVARASRTDLRVTTMRTSLGQIVGTLPYMSPEQVLGEGAEADTRSDVYALGVLLYQILSGRLPLDVTRGSLAEAARVVREQEPTRLGSIDRSLRGDPETIVGKALDKSPSRRYQSASDLAADLRRCIAGDPILARQDSAMYLLRKQMRRYRLVIVAAAVALAGIAVFALHASLSASIQRHLAEEAKRAQGRAERESDRATVAGLALEAQLSKSNIERARLEGLLGYFPRAEHALWDEHFRNPASLDARWALWELYNRHPCRWTLPGTPAPLCVALSPDRATLATGTLRGIIELRSMLDPDRVLATLTPGKGPIQSVAFAPDGSFLAVGFRSGALATLDLPSTELSFLNPPHTAPVSALTVSPDLSIASGTTSGEIAIWDPASRRRTASASARGVINSLAFDPDARRLASSHRPRPSTFEATIWNAHTLTPIQDLPPIAWTFSMQVRFHHQRDALFIIFGDRTTRLYPLDSTSPPTLVGRHESTALCIEPSPDNSTLFITGGYTASLYDADSFAHQRDLSRFSAPILWGGWIDDHSVVMVTTDGFVRAFDVRREPAARFIHDLDNWSFATAFAPDSSWFVFLHGTKATIADTRTLQRRAEFALPPPMRSRAVRVRADGTIVLGAGDGKIRLLDPADATLLDTLDANAGEIYSLALHPFLPRAIAGHSDGTARIWDLDSRSLLNTISAWPERVLGAAFSPDGRHVALTGSNEGVGVFDAETGSLVRLVPTSSYAWGVAFTTDGSLLLAGTDEGAVVAIDTTSWTTVEVRREHLRLIASLDVSPDGRFFITGSDDGEVRLWDPRSRRVLATLSPGGREVPGIAFDPSSRFIAACTQDRMVALYDLLAIDPFIEGNRRSHLPPDAHPDESPSEAPPR